MPQRSFPNSKYDSLWYTGEVFCDEPCAVRIGDGHITIDYVDCGSKVQYRGTELGAGHFELACPEVSGRATLHMFRNSREMVGYWVENGYRGLWRIHLGESMAPDAR